MIALYLNSFWAGALKRSFSLVVLLTTLEFVGLNQGALHPETLIWGSLLLARDVDSKAASRRLLFSRGVRPFDLALYGVVIRSLPILLIVLPLLWFGRIDVVAAIHVTVLGVVTSTLSALFQVLTDSSIFVPFALSILTLSIINILSFNNLEQMSSGELARAAIAYTLLLLGFGSAYTFSLRIY